MHKKITKEGLEQLEIEQCLKGVKLYGDDFSEEQIQDWFEDEKDGYFGLTESEDNNYVYGYHALNIRHGFRHIQNKGGFSDVLGIGSAYGEELRPILKNCSSRITIVEPSDGFKVDSLDDIPLRYVKPKSGGKYELPQASFDLILCFGVLHHIPNVSSVIKDFYSFLKPGGYCLIRENVTSMGDWRKPRRGLTKRERGIPKEILEGIIKSTGFEIVYKSNCIFSLTSRLRIFTKKPVFNSGLIVQLDRLICSLPIWSNKYHPNHFLQKIRPSSVFYVIRKVSNG